MKRFYRPLVTLIVFVAVSIVTYSLASAGEVTPPPALKIDAGDHDHLGAHHEKHRHVIPDFEWKKEYMSLKNPFSGDPGAALAGKEIYHRICMLCHGHEGKADGSATVSLSVAPFDFTKGLAQVDNAEARWFYYITAGILEKDGTQVMQGYWQTLTWEQRWQLVEFLKSFSK